LLAILAGEGAKKLAAFLFKKHTIRNANV